MIDDTGIGTRDLRNKTGVIIFQNIQAVDYLKSSYVGVAGSKNLFIEDSRRTLLLHYIYSSAKWGEFSR